MNADVKVKNILASLYDMSKLIRIKCQGLDKELESMRLLVQRALDFQLFSVFQYDYLSKKLVPLYMYGDPFSLVDAVNFRLGKGATGWCLQHKKPLLIKNLERKDGSNRFFVNSFLSVPIIINAQIIGVAVIGSFIKGQYNEADRFLFEILAPLMGNLLLKQDFALEKEPAELK